MKISELIKLLNDNKKVYGDLEVSFDAMTVDPNADEVECVHEVCWGASILVTVDGSVRRQRQLVLGSDGDSVFDLEAYGIVE